ncbi:HAD family phosphatase [Nocardioides sp. CFH 31398]|uniref:HAD family hydrolase n=1 Tax=Nocardioides sp. CFH 31398 TaxID=2919579 RepID=UPI001F05466B|nr:HAD-IA family hydrolase [Nocardioides sp. CFH 31398]MCH1865764.1 HAD-IA family hydrolase [Nocardioides sp. CFH 31398]
MTSILFGSISSVADTSELQRWAFNKAFADAGLDWSWDREDYREMLTGNGGADRVRAYAEQRGEQVDADAIHAAKSEAFRSSLAKDGAEARPGVVETVQAAKSLGMRVALVTTTSPENVEALLTALSPALTRDDFDLVLDTTSVETTKPDPAVYAKALAELGEEAGACVAIEDNVGGVQAAKAAGVACIAFPNANTVAHDFSAADRTVDRLDPADVTGLLEA